MNKIIVMCDSTCDLSEELINKYDIKVVPLHVSFPNDSKDYLDGVNIFAEEIYKRCEENGFTPKTGAINIGEFINYFKKYIDDGFDIIYTGIGAELSSSYNNALVAIKEFEEGRIEIVDSENLSTGSGLLVLKMCQFRDQGDNVHEIARKVRLLTKNVSAKFCINTLEYLYKGGRCSGMTSLFASMLKIHPIAKMINGKLTVYQKPRGKYEKAVDLQIEEFIKDLPCIDKSHIFITHSGRIDGMDEYVYEKIKQYVPTESIHITRAGCVVSSHCGPKTIGILYIVNK